MSSYKATGIHTVCFNRPERKGEKESVRKRNMANRKYGTKKGVGVSDKCLDFLWLTESLQMIQS